MSVVNRNNIKYVYDLPYSERMDVCRILDMNDKWEILAGQHMKFDMMTIQELRREVRCGRSPTDELLTRWGHQNHTILELFVHLSKMQHYRAMTTIKKFVDAEFHKLIYEGEANLSKFFDKRLGPSNNTAKNDTQANLNLSNSSNELVSKLEGIPRSTPTEIKTLNIPVHGRSIACGNEAPTALAHNTNNNNNKGPKMSPSMAGDSSRDRGEGAAGVEIVGLPMIPFKELEIATNGWDTTAILGKGGFGTVFKGVWKKTAVAVKRTRSTPTDENQTIQIQQILGELRMLNNYRHDNILPLYGYSVNGEDPCLIYQFMPNGSLEDRLLRRQATAPLSWTQRLNIAVGTARGLQFLHTINEKPLIHGDIKSANILLDSSLKPKIGDFGLAREGPQSNFTHVTVTRVHGTKPYLPHEFLRGKKFSTKVDTHCFGIVLYELSTGLRAYDEQRSHKFLRDLIKSSSEVQIANLIDRKAQPEDQQTYKSLMDLGKICSSYNAKDRPEMVVVLQELEAVMAQRELMLKAQQQVQRNSLTAFSPYELQLLHDHLSQQRNNNGSPVPDSRASPRVMSPMPDSRTNGRMASPLQDDAHYQRMISPLPDSRMSPTLLNRDSPLPDHRVSPQPMNVVRGNQVNPMVPPELMNNAAIRNPGVTAHAPTHPVNNPFADGPANQGSARFHNTGIVPPHLRQRMPNGHNQVVWTAGQGAGPKEAFSPSIAVSPPSIVSSAHSDYSSDFTEESFAGPIPATVAATMVPEMTSTGTTEEDVIDSQYSGILPLISVLGIKNRDDQSQAEPVEELTHTSSISAPSTAKGKSLLF